MILGQGALAILDNEKVIDIIDLPVMSEGKKIKTIEWRYLSDYLKKYIQTSKILL